MRKLLLTSTILATMAGLAPAYAANTAIILWNGANPGDAETATGTGQALLASSNLDGITISLSLVNRETGPNGITESNVNIVNTTNAVQTLHIIAGANGFFGATGGFGLSATILTALGTSDLSGSFFADATNSLNGQSFTITGTDLGDFNSGALNGPHSFSFNSFSPDTLNVPYGLAESLTLTLQPFSQIGVQSISMDAVSQVPEPSTWAMGLAGFAFLAFFGMQRARKDRLASI